MAAQITNMATMTAKTTTAIIAPFGNFILALGASGDTGIGAGDGVSLAMG